MAKANKPDSAPIDLPGDAPPEEATKTPEPTGMAALTRGREVLQAALRNIPQQPGVYRMIDSRGDALYVGKARNLNKRLQAYAGARGLATRILQMVGQTRAVEVVSTHTEVEALLLESNLIKRLKPRFNILLRDDKSFPYILLRRDQAWPQLAKHRGARNRPGDYFGPFASAGAVNRTLNTLQRAFPLRSCSDTVFEARTRPCLQYQIKRCTAPCVGRTDAQDYARLVNDARDFLSGRSQEVQRQMVAHMQAASEAQAFERAAGFRDRLRALAHIQSHQGINVAGIDEADVLAVHQEGGQSCVQVFFFRAGQNWGNRPFYPSHGREDGAGAVLAAFLGQFYDDKAPPREVLVNVELPERAILEQGLSVKAGRRVHLIWPQRGVKRELVEQAQANAREALSRRLAESGSQRRLLDAVAELFGLEGPLERIEIYDNSHVQGSDAIGAMVVAGSEGFCKSAYRKFNIRNAALTPGDDYGMLREVLTRRFQRLFKGDDDEAADRVDRRIAGEWPDLVLIDGGAGQLAVARAAFEELGINDVPLVAIAKGVERNAGREQFHQPGKPPMLLEPRSPALYFLQRLRDEAHRFAIGSHRLKRGKSMVRSALDELPGVGPKRKRALLHHFGSLRAIRQAALADLQAVEGISHGVAQKIYDHFNTGAS
ncbi:MAG: excinuclease ABC subunit UvrC [Alphaproteobacteria bacterium]|nr:excinuclease ABC subunit UvrC [Alphaproteobacteria bacterium]